MKKNDSAEKKDPAQPPVAPLRSSKSDIGSSPHHQNNQEDQEAQREHHRPGIIWIKRWNCMQFCLVTVYVALSFIAVLISIAVIVVTGLACVATKVYDAEQSSRLVAMVVLAVSSAIGLSMIIYAIIGAFKKKTMILHSSGIVLLILAIIQALVIGVAINVTAKDELSIAKYLGQSFRLAKENNARHVKLWSSTQSELQCCGFISPEDYRDPLMPFYFPPNVPISCCPSYDDKKPPYNQERERELCKVNETYFASGCKGVVVQVFKETALVVITIVAVLIINEVIIAIVGVRLIKKMKKSQKAAELEHREDYELPHHHANK